MKITKIKEDITSEIAKSFKNSIAIDTEATGLQIPERDKLSLIQICDEMGNVFIIQPNKDNYKAPNLVSVLENKNILKNKICLICCRGGSKTIKNKNIKNFAGRPLLSWILKEAKKTIMEEANKYQKSTDVSVLDNFYNAVHVDKFKPLLKGYNKEVQDLFVTGLYKETNSVGTQLFGSVLKEHGILTINNKKKELFEYDVMSSANDPRERDKADKLKIAFYNNPENKSVFGENGLNALKEESTLRTLSLRYKLNTKNDPLSVLMLGEENIANDVANEGLAKQIYDNAGKALISKAVEERKIEEDKWVFVEGCKHPKSVTLLLRGGSQRVVDEVERSVHDALMVVKDVILKPQIVAGGGAPETYASTKLRSWAKSLEGREQLAAEKFADALESIPLTLSENAGMDPIDTLTVLRSKQQKGEKWTGIDVMKGKIGNMKSSDIIEPLAVKLQIVSAAAEAACMILRIDDVIATQSSGGGGGGEGGMPPGMPPGMGGMGGMPPGMGGMPDMGGMM